MTLQAAVRTQEDSISGQANRLAECKHMPRNTRVQDRCSCSGPCSQVLPGSAAHVGHAGLCRQLTYQAASRRHPTG